MNGGDQQLVGPFVRNNGEALMFGCWTSGWANGEEIQAGTGGPPASGSVSVSAWNDSDSGNNFHLMIWNQQSGTRTIFYICFGAL